MKLVNASLCYNKQSWNEDECREELIDKERCDKGSVFNPSNCGCECDIGEYLDYKNCKYRRKLVNWSKNAVKILMKMK